MINIKDLSFKYRKSDSLFNKLNLTLETGNIYGVLGKNGAGKTSLLKIISGMLYANKGECTLNGINTNERKPSTYKDMFFIPEDFELPKITIEQFVKIHAPFYPNFSHDQFHQYLHEFKLNSSRHIKQLSFGQAKMVIISFGIATNTKYLILDEPTNALDIPSKSVLRKILTNAISPERSFIISTHQIRDLESIIDPIVIIDQGKIILNKSCEDIMKKYRFEQCKNINIPGIIYSEERLGNFSTISLNNANDYTNLNLELLFNGVINKGEYFSDKEIKK